MKSFVENKESLVIRRSCNIDLLDLNLSTKHKEAILNNAYSIGEELVTASDALNAHLDDIENTILLIFNGIEAKMDYMESYCESLIANSSEIPKGKFGTIKVYDQSELILNGMSYSKGLGIIMESSQWRNQA